MGASDFDLSWGSVPAVDLTEHEIGHTLGLPHSGDPASSDQHASGIDLMSNSAAPRDVHPDRRNGPDTLAINRLALGWLNASDVVVAASGGGVFDLAASTGGQGVRLLVLPLTADSFLTVDYLTADGFNDFLPLSGLAVHKIDQSDAACAAAASAAKCTGPQRVQATLGSSPPHLELLSKPGESWILEGWAITLRAAGSAAQVEVRPGHR